MNRTDVIVAGAGMAGLLAALAAARNGRTVKLITEGVGSLAISGGCIDLLGYVGGKAVEHPWQALDSLEAGHPYRILGRDRVHAALAAFEELTAAAGYPYTAPADGRNRRIPTIMGTLKPSWLCSPAGHAEALASARRVLVLGVEGFKDCHPAVVVRQLKRYPEMAGKEFTSAMIRLPERQRRRTLSPLDVARFLDTDAGRAWMERELTPHGGRYDAALLPPICGTHADDGARQILSRALACPVLEMLSIPPGVGGLRLREMLCGELARLGVTLVENATVSRGEVTNGRCTALVTTAPDAERRHEAAEFILATGGVLGGGIATEPGRARERICAIPIEMPEDPEQWSTPELFAQHAITSMGVRVDAQLRPVGPDGAVLLRNVRFAGRTLGGYDFGLEKSGFGVAIATGWTAGSLA